MASKIAIAGTKSTRVDLSEKNDNGETSRTEAIVDETIVASDEEENLTKTISLVEVDT